MAATTLGDSSPKALSLKSLPLFWLKASIVLRLILSGDNELKKAWSSRVTVPEAKKERCLEQMEFDAGEGGLTLEMHGRQKQHNTYVQIICQV